MAVVFMLTGCHSTQETVPTYTRTELPNRTYDGPVLTPSDPEDRARIDQMPTAEGGMPQIQQRIGFPRTARYYGLETTVYVVFTVGPDGQPYDVAIARAPAEEVLAELSEGEREALADLQHRAKQVIWRSSFEPGIADGEPAAIQSFWPLTFRIR
ncbi:MAG: hypothetical protein GVY15_04505 [Bacteroidetes bacterium]|nr:hypothetical protein [Bacteroidota bacterium]